MPDCAPFCGRSTGRNRTAYTVVDHIYHATVDAEGNLANEAVVLSPADSTGSAWDSYHVCDPSVIAGRFHYNGHDYRYLMAYLGVRGRPGDSSCDGARCVNNKVGLAVSDSLVSGWTRMGADSVVITGTPAKWGVGQPSIVGLDGAGRVALFYAGDYGTRCLTLDFSDAASTAASLVTKTGDQGTAVSTSGIADLKGLRLSGVTITNGDFAWDRENGCLYLAADLPDAYNGFYDGGGYGLSVTKAVAIYRAAIGSLTTENLAAAKWEMVARIRPLDLAADFSSSFRIHNAGLVRRGSGALAEKGVFVSVTHLETNPLYTYRFQPVSWGEN